MTQTFDITTPVGVMEGLFTNNEVYGYTGGDGYIVSVSWLRTFNGIDTLYTAERVVQGPWDVQETAITLAKHIAQTDIGIFAIEKESSRREKGDRRSVGDWANHRFVTPRLAYYPQKDQSK